MRLIFFSILALPLLGGCMATAIVGGASATGAAINDERSVGRHADDLTLSTKIDVRLAAEKDMPSRWVSNEVIDGNVVLTGHLPTQEHVNRALYIVEHMKGVRSVKNEIQVGEPATPTTVADSWITTKVKMALWNDKEVSGFSIHVETVEGKVYLTGLVDNAAHRQRAIDLAKAVDGVVGVVDLMQTDQK